MNIYRCQKVSCLNVLNFTEKNASEQNFKCNDCLGKLTKVDVVYNEYRFAVPFEKFSFLVYLLTGVVIWGASYSLDLIEMGTVFEQEIYNWASHAIGFGIVYLLLSYRIYIFFYKRAQEVEDNLRYFKAWVYAFLISIFLVGFSQVVQST